ncbi:Pre-mRNA splicing factor ATP-dependent RNA helicase [Cryptosporidium hominis]|uniref:RNA helicase n=1 Tax=Cryptosporidium hominis TaxID=237895 RepID=A0ABX5BKL6_CRYHO|nr:RNA helicase [Cryptosporidium hominis TU502]PPS98252.1 Pre-mRNA splicing factor ATP-dependent RNA helicase [Cryptosporidium hominis]|eukprot:PPS98252.1 Pre-mRNA splicing factor ATP-dependent RNA helicase [Cryptosporidium hominis]
MGSGRKRIKVEENGKSIEVDKELNPWNNDKPYSNKYYELRKFRKSLPAWSERKTFCKLVKKNQVVILVGDTGSGKTTQCPQFILESGLGGNLKIACTQPRRVAAMSVAQRVSEEMDVCLGDVVGYTIRFEDKTNENTRLKYVTDGMLLREAMYDNDLSQYGVIIIDEAHERTISTDILMGSLKEILLRRSFESKNPLRLVVMSATLESTKFQSYFGNDSPVFSIPGRMFPVELIYNIKPEKDYLEASIQKVLDIHENEVPGDILLFLTGEEEIEQAKQRLEFLSSPLEEQFGELVIIPLYSSLPPYKQQKIFDKTPGPKYPGGPTGRKVVISTNIAETSVTIDGIVYVIDPGFSKQKVYNPRTRVESLLVSPISKASAKQRMGRAGRTKEGKCFRLYTKEAFESELADQTHPEILRSNLSNVVLILKSLGINDLVHFDFMDPPAPETLMRALEQLYFLEAMDDEGELTKLGKLMTEFPIDPQLARMLIKSSELGCASQILSLASLLNVPNIFLRPRDKSKEADYAKSSFVDPDGDHLTLLYAFESFREVLYKDENKAKKFAKENFLNYRALISAENVRKQLERTYQKHILNTSNHISSDNDQISKSKLNISIRKAITQGFFMQAACLHRSGHYTTVRDNQVVHLHPSCVLSSKPEWVLYNEFVLTSRNFIRTVTKIRGEWLLEISPKYYNLEDFPECDSKKKLAHLNYFSNKKF